jgi:hypothetical protein
MASCPTVSSSVPHIKGEVAQERLTVFAPVRTVCDKSPMTVRGGGVRPVPMASMPFLRMGPPPRSSAFRLERFTASMPFLFEHDVLLEQVICK